VFDLQIHPRDHDLIAATFGRGIWITNISPLEQMTGSVLADAAHLFKPNTAYEFGEAPGADESTAQGAFEVASAPYGAEIAYRLTSPARAETVANNDGGAENDSGNGNGNARRGGGRNQVRIVITNVSGDTVQTVNGPGTVGLHFVNWNFRGKPAPSKPLSPAGKRDSIVAARKMNAVFDSLEKAGTAPKAQLDRLRKELESGGDLRALFRRGGGGRGGVPGQFEERPAEGPLPGAAGARGRGGAGGGAAASGMDPDVMSTVFDALRSAGAVQRRGGFFGGGAGDVSEGDYLVTLTVGGQKYSQPLHVEQVSGAHGEAVDVVAGSPRQQ